MKKNYLQPQIEETTLLLQIGVMSGNSETPPVDLNNPGEGGFAPARKIYV